MLKPMTSMIPMETLDDRAPANVLYMPKANKTENKQHLRNTVTEHVTKHRHPHRYHRKDVLDETNIIIPYMLTASRRSKNSISGTR